MSSGIFVKKNAGKRLAEGIVEPIVVKMFEDPAGEHKGAHTATIFHATSKRWLGRFALMRRCYLARLRAHSTGRTFVNSRQVFWSDQWDFFQLNNSMKSESSRGVNDPAGIANAE